MGTSAKHGSGQRELEHDEAGLSYLTLTGPFRPILSLFSRAHFDQSSPLVLLVTKTCACCRPARGRAAYHYGHQRQQQHAFGQQQHPGPATGALGQHGSGHCHVSSVAVDHLHQQQAHWQQPYTGPGEADTLTEPATRYWQPQYMQTHLGDVDVPANVSQYSGHARCLTGGELASGQPPYPGPGIPAAPPHGGAHYHVSSVAVEHQRQQQQQQPQQLAHWQRPLTRPHASTSPYTSDGTIHGAGYQTQVTMSGATQLVEVDVHANARRYPRYIGTMASGGITSGQQQQQQQQQEQEQCGDG